MMWRCWVQMDNLINREGVLSRPDVACPLRETCIKASKCSSSFLAFVWHLWHSVRSEQKVFDSLQCIVGNVFPDEGALACRSCYTGYTFLNGICESDCMVGEYATAVVRKLLLCTMKHNFQACLFESSVPVVLAQLGGRCSFSAEKGLCDCNWRISWVTHLTPVPLRHDCTAPRLM